MIFGLALLLARHRPEIISYQWRGANWVDPKPLQEHRQSQLLIICVDKRVLCFSIGIMVWTIISVPIQVYLPPFSPGLITTCWINTQYVKFPIEPGYESIESFKVQSQLIWAYVTVLLLTWSDAGTFYTHFIGSFDHRRSPELQALPICESVRSAITNTRANELINYLALTVPTTISQAANTLEDRGPSPLHARARAGIGIIRPFETHLFDIIIWTIHKTRNQAKLLCLG